MKKVSVVLTIVLAGLLGAGSVWAHDLIVGLSPYQEAKRADAQVKATLQFLTDTLQPGQSALVIDAYHIRTLGMFTVPNKSVYRHAKAKLQANRQVVGAMLNFAKTARTPQGGTEPSIPGAIRLPQALAFVGQNYPAKGKAQVVLLGSPLFDDPAEHGFSMSQGRIPGDGHLTHGRAQTPYGIKGQENLLAQWNIHLGFPDESWRRNDHHGYYVQRFWTLHIEGQGGKLATFTGDLPTLWQRVQSHASPPAHTFTVEDTDKLEMIILKPRVVKDTASIYERPITQTPLATEHIHQAPNIEIGLSWDCGGCDLDLYAQNGHGEAALSFLNKETASGVFYKDMVRSPRAINGFETIAYQVPVNLAKLVLAVNFYGGSAANGVRGELRLSLNGQTYAKPFHVQASEGNKGQGREETLNSRQAASAHWLVINPLEVIGQPSDGQALAQK